MSTVPARSGREFAPGDLLVDPRHGVVEVEGFESRPNAGKPQSYLRLRAVNGLTILLPEESAGTVGLRRPIDVSEVEQVLGVLSSERQPVPPWRQREFFLFSRRVESGNPREVASVLRDLLAKEREKGLGSNEKTLRDKATDILATELALVLNTSTDTAAKRIVAAAEGRV